MIIEILGSPEKFVNETIEKVISELGKREGIRIINKDVAEAKKVEKFYSAFVDAEIEVDDLATLTNISFDFMPSSIEIIEPEKLEFDASGVQDFFNDLLARLHRYDMVVKNLRAENKVLRQTKR